MLRDDSIMKLINLLIKELDNCSLGADFRVSRHAEICQFDRFSLEINFKRARSCNYGIPRLVKVKMKILYWVPRWLYQLARTGGLSPSQNSVPPKSKNLFYCKPQKVNF